MKSFSNETIKFFPRKVLGLITFWISPKIASAPANVVAEIQRKLSNKRDLSTCDL